MNKLDVQNIRKDFPILENEINGNRLVYFDSAATTLKPRSVADRIHKFYLFESSNVHRGLHFLSDQATENFEIARRKIQKFVNAKEDSEIIFTKGTTDSINLVAQSLGAQVCEEGDQILISDIEHHSNIVPWQLLAEGQGCQIQTFITDENGTPNLDDFKNKLKPNVKIVSLTYVSNSLGVIFPLKEMIRLAHANRSIVVIDGAQAVAHQKVDVQDLDCDFFAFSAHKLYGPTGMGVLYGKYEFLEKMKPIAGGGGMIDEVHFEKSTFLKPPFRFEAGTPHISGAIGLAAAIDYICQFDMSAICQHEHELTQYCQKKLTEIAGAHIFARLENKGPIISFYIKDVHSTDIGSLLDQEGIAVRCGHHCTQPLMKKLGVTGTVRASFGIYNIKQEVDQFIESLSKVIKIIKG